MNKFNSLLFVLVLIGCSANTAGENETLNILAAEMTLEDTLVILEEKMYCNDEVKVGAERLDLYLEELDGQRVGVVGNQSSQVGNTHLVDTLLSLGVDVVKVFSPEHGFRGTADAGERVDNEVDVTTGLPIISLYGSNRKPKASQLTDVDILLFDIQDVGVRFYTYISTLHYVMEAAKENSKSIIVLDRPNPNGHYVDGPILEEAHSSFIGMHKVPTVHGMSIGEYAQMINGEGWLSNSSSCDLTVISCENWDHTKFYELPIAPSPNLPNMAAVYLYPTLCFFEGTTVSIGRGTDYPFQHIGHPDFKVDSVNVAYSFTPQPNSGAKHPKLEGELCYGVDLHDTDLKVFRENPELDLSQLYAFYKNLDLGKDFFLSNNFIDLLAGNSSLRKSILSGGSFEEYEATWRQGLDEFKEMRKKYLLYKV